jgi:eukaryotic-like serine/threonine-protein kinase
LDVSGLRDDPNTIFDTRIKSLSQSSKSIESTESIESIEPGTGLRSLARLLRQLLVQSNLLESGIESNAIVENLSHAFDDCMTGPLANMPTASDVLLRLGYGLPAEPISHSADKESFSDDGVTMEVDVNLQTPSGFLLDGTRLGPYTIRQRLGSGGMGAVYRADDPIHHRSVAIKILNQQVAPDSNSARRFAKEARLLAKANNPYVANLFEVVSESELPYMVVEYVEGGTLGAILQSARPLNESFGLTLMIDAIRGLAIAHARGVIHRDFKPDNVLLTTDAKNWIASNNPYADSSTDQSAPAIGRIYAKVSDFGLARTAEQSESMALTRQGTAIGTPLYMSPEQWQGQAMDPRVDIYSIGITLFQILTGMPPFKADTNVGLMTLHCSGPIPSLKKLRPDISDALVQVVEKCLAKNPEARYTDASDLVVDLENLLRGDPTSLGLHPAILSLTDPEVMQFEHSWQLQSSPHQLWPYLSNTDRVNHAMGLSSVTYTTRQDPIHGVQRFAETKVSGLVIRWQEHPYEWIEGKRLSVLREFTQGPFRWFVNVVELTQVPGSGTLVTQRLIVTPRNWIGKQLAKLQLGNKAKDNFGRTYKQIDSFISQSEFNRADRDPFIGRTELRAGQRERLRSRIEQLESKNIDPRVVDTLAQYLENASDLEVARIRPIAFAQRFQLDPQQVINACFEGTRLGIFSLLWDIMCPSCRIPSDVQETLAAIKDHGYCEACNLDYAIDLSDSVELIFRIHPEIREVTTAVYCIGGPAWSRHVVAQVRLASGERFACELNLSEGSYVVRGLQMPFTINVQVGHSSLEKRAEFSLARPPANSKTMLGLGSQVIHLCNDSAVDQQIRIERTANRDDALSAARASTMSLFRELFPDEVLSADQIVSVAHITILRLRIDGATQLYQQLGDSAAFSQIRKSLQTAMDTIKQNSGAVVKTIGEGLLASFPDSMGAARAAIELVRQCSDAELRYAVAIHTGSAMVATIDDRLDYFGKTLQTLESFLETAEPGTVQASSVITANTDVQRYLKSQSVSLHVGAQSQVTSGDIAIKIVP